MMLQIDSLKKRYGSFELDCTLSVPAGRITGLVGANGAGKSTIFKAALGLIRPDGGEIRVLGKNVRDFTAKDKYLYGAVLADSGFWGDFTIRDLTPVLQNMYPDFKKEDFGKKSEQLGLPPKKPIKEFSTGMTTKLKVLAALSHGAKLLLLDEPTTGLDVTARDEILNMIREFMEQEDHAVLISSHISRDLEGLCDDFFMVHEGKILLHEDTDVLLGQYAVLKVDEEQYRALDKRYLLRSLREPYGYRCLTGQRQFYLENAPYAAVEKSGLDDLIYMMIKGERICGD